MCDYPDDLKPSTWEKKKGSLPPQSDVAEKLKTLQKKHEAVEWKSFEPVWAKKAKSVAELDEAFAARDKTYRSAVFELKKVANEAATAAQLLSRAKDATKLTKDAVSDIVGATTRYAKAIDAGAKELQETHEKARSALEKAEPEKDDAADHVLLHPQKLLSQLKKCARDSDYRVHFGFVDAKEKKPPVLALHPRVKGRALFAQLKELQDVATGTYGTAWIHNKTLIFQMQKAFSGLVKKARVPIRACGFRIAKIVLWSADGEVLEQDEDATDSELADQDAQGSQAEGGSVAQQEARRQYKDTIKAYLATLPADVRALAATAPEAASSLVDRLKQARVLVLSGEWAQAHAVLEAVAREVAQIRGAARAADATATVPEGMVAKRVRTLELAAASWQVQRIRSIQGLGELAANLLTQDDPHLLAIAVRISALVSGIPNALDARLEAVRKAIEVGDTAAAKTARDGVTNELSALATFLEDEEADLRKCEDNPFGISVRVVAPLSNTINTIQDVLARV